MEELNVKLGVDGKEWGPELKGAADAFKKFGADVSSSFVAIDGSVGNFGKTIGQLETQLNSFKNGIKNSTNPESILRLERAAESAAKRINELNTFARSGGKSFVTFAGGAGNANNAIQELSRGIQDAPFGSIGYINNLQQFQSLFGNLVTQAGSFKGALKALGSSLMGPAGIGVAFSVLTAGLQIYSMWQQRAKKDTEDATKANEKYFKSLGGLAELTFEATKSQTTEISKLDILYRASQNQNLSLAERKKATDALQSQYPATFKGLTDEAILAGKAADKYKELKTQLLAIGVVNAANADINKQAETIYTATIKQGVAQAKLNETQKEFNAFLADTKADFSEFSYADQGAQTTIYQNKIKALTAEIKSYDGVISNANKNTTSAIAVQDKLVKQFGVTPFVDGLDKKFDAAATKAKALREQIAALNASRKLEGLNAGQRLAEDIAAFGTNLAKSLKAADKSDGMDKLITKTQKLHDEEIKASKGATPLIDQTDLENAGRLLDEYNSLVDTTLMNVSSAFANFFTGIFTQGQLSFKALGNAILSEFARVLSSAIAKKLFQFLSNLVPGAGVVAGGGGGFFGKIIKALIPGFDNGVTNFGGGLAYVHAGEVLTNLAPGTSVIPASVVSGFGGAQSQVFIASSTVRGSDIRTVYNRADRTNSRIV